jgi:hypothetical protein
VTSFVSLLMVLTNTAPVQNNVGHARDRDSVEIQTVWIQKAIKSQEKVARVLVVRSGCARKKGEIDPP